MTEQEEKYTLQGANLKFAKMLNGETWGFLEKQDRTADEDDRMVHAAHASLYHWLQVGTVVNQQRGEYMLARVYATVGIPEEAARHGQRCVQLSLDHANEMADFDQPFAYECLARAYACAGNREEALRYIAESERAGEGITDPEDKKIWRGEMDGGDWFGVK